MKKWLVKGMRSLMVMLLIICMIPANVIANDLETESTDAEINYTNELNGETTFEQTIIPDEDSEKTQEHQGFEYQELNGVIVICGYNNLADDPKELVIPEFIDGKIVEKINESAFKDNLQLQEVVISKNVRYIDKTAFDGCKNLEKYTVDPENQVYYGETGQLFDKSSHTLYLSPEKLKTEATTAQPNPAVSDEKLEAKEQTTIITSMDSVPALSESGNIDQQIVVIYNNNSGAMNVSSLEMDMTEIKSGENVSDCVDVFEIKDNVNPETVISQIAENPNVLAVEKNLRYEATALPNDTYITNGAEWQFSKIGTDKTWNMVTNTTPVVVAVLDTGLNLAHPDLQGRIVAGYDYYTKSSNVLDLMGHGTTVSGCIAATSNNGVGVAGIAGTANIKVAPYRVGGSTADDRYLYTSYICAALMTVADRSDVKVINMSFGGYSYDSAQAAAINYAKNKGKVLVAAAGNEGSDVTYRGMLSYPASYDGVISVAATDSSNSRTYFSQYNSMVDVAAPGSYVYTTLKTGGYGSASGTSFSSPITAAVCAVMMADDPTLSATQVENILKSTATDLGSTGRDNYFGYGLIRIDNALNYVRSLTPFSVKSFTISPVANQYVSNIIKMTGEGTGGKAPYQYKFSYTYNGTTTIVKNFSTTNTATFTPSKPGTYQLTMELKDARGVVLTENVNDYTVVTIPQVTSLTADKVSGQVIGTKINLKAAGSGGINPVMYKFYYKLGATTTIVKDYSAQDSVDFTPSLPGVYTLAVDMKDASGKISTKTLTNYSVVNPLSVKTLTANKATGQGIDSSITLTATGSDGKAPYQYQFSATLAGTTTIIKEYSTTGSATFIPAKAGDYTLTVDLKDAAGNTATKSISPYTILADPTVASFTATAPNGQGINTSIALAASGSNGKAPYQYKFYWKKGSVTTIIQNFGSPASVTFKPLATGTYTLCVDIKDANGRIGTKTIDSYEIYGAPTVKNLTADKAIGQYVGTAINLTATGSDGKAPYQYQFYTKLGTVTTILKAYNVAGNTAIFTPTAAGAYTLGVDVKDANGIVTTKTIANYAVIANPSVKSFTPGKASGQAIATTIPLTALGTGGKAPYQYQFSYTLAGATTLIKDYSTSGSATFIPTQAGDYRLTVTIKDNGGKTATQTIDPYTILTDPTVASFTTTAPNGPGVNTGIILSATGSSGKAPYQYQFYYKQGTTKVILRAFAVTDSATFKPTKAGVYDLYVDVKDANGRIATRSIAGYAIYTGPTVTSLITDKVSGQYVNTAIALTAAGTGGTPASDGYRYTFYYMLGTSTEKVSIQSESKSATATFTPKQAGIYTLCADIKDANGIIATRTLVNYKVIANPVLKSFTTSKTSGQLVNSSIVLTAIGAEGKLPYQYRFSYLDGTGTTVIRDYSTLNTAVFRPTKSGVYTLLVEMKDGGGKSASKSIEKYVIN